MRGQHEARENGGTSKFTNGSFLSQLKPAAVNEFNGLAFTSSYPKGAVLFMEKQEPRGVYLLCEGQAKISMSSSEGKKVILKIANAGEVIGIESAFSGKPYEFTAESLRPCQVAFIRRADFLQFVARHPEIFAAVIRQMVAQYRTACEQIRTLGLSTSVTERVAKLLLVWTAASGETKPVRTTLPLTHEEIGEFIGTTRESVTRTLSDLKSRRLVAIKGVTLTVPDRTALEECVQA